MLASMFRPKRPRRTSERSPLLPGLHASQDAVEHEESDSQSGNDGEYDEGDSEDFFHNADVENQALLPMFSAEHLGTQPNCGSPYYLGHVQLTCAFLSFSLRDTTDRIPVYHLQHNIRLLVVERCETTLTWDQLRSPQISQFLVKPIQQRIRASHLNRATLYALFANCLQFHKDGQMNPGLVGVSRTRALMCELLGMRILKEASTREVCHALQMIGFLSTMPGVLFSQRCWREEIDFLSPPSPVQERQLHQHVNEKNSL